MLRACQIRQLTNHVQSLSATHGWYLNNRYPLIILGSLHALIGTIHQNFSHPFHNHTLLFLATVQFWSGAQSHSLLTLFALWCWSVVGRLLTFGFCCVSCCNTTACVLSQSKLSLLWKTFWTNALPCLLATPFVVFLSACCRRYTCLFAALSPRLPLWKTDWLHYTCANHSTFRGCINLIIVATQFSTAAFVSSFGDNTKAVNPGLFCWCNSLGTDGYHRNERCEAIIPKLSIQVCFADATLLGRMATIVTNDVTFAQVSIEERKENVRSFFWAVSFADMYMKLSLQALRVFHRNMFRFSCLVLFFLQNK